MTNKTEPLNPFRILPYYNRRCAAFEENTQYPRSTAEAFIYGRGFARTDKTIRDAQYRKAFRLMGDITMADYLSASKAEREAMLATRKAVIADADFQTLFHIMDTLHADYAVWAYRETDRAMWEARVQATKGRYDRIVSRAWAKIGRTFAGVGCILFLGFVALTAVVVVHDYTAQPGLETVEEADPEYKHEGDINMGRYYTDAERNAMDNPAPVRSTPTDADIIHTVQSAGFVCNDVRRTQKINKGFIIECDGGLYTSKHNGASWKVSVRK